MSPSSLIISYGRQSLKMLYVAHIHWCNTNCLLGLKVKKSILCYVPFPRVLWGLKTYLISSLPFCKNLPPHLKPVYGSLGYKTTLSSPWSKKLILSLQIQKIPATATTGMVGSINAIISYLVDATDRSGSGGGFWFAFCFV